MIISFTVIMGVFVLLTLITMGIPMYILRDDPIALFIFAFLALALIFSYSVGCGFIKVV